MAWITLKQASNISGKSERTIRHYVTQVRKKFGDKFENDYYKYELQPNGKYTLIVKHSFITGKDVANKTSNANASVSNVANDLKTSRNVNPGLNDIEELVERRTKIINERHELELKRIEQRHREEMERLDSNNNKLLDTLEVGAVRMIDQHNNTTDMLKGQVNRLEQQLLAKDEIMKGLLDDMRAIRLERNEVVSNYIDVPSVPTEEQKNEALRDEVFQEVIDEEQIDLDDKIEDNINRNELESDIEKAIENNMTFADFLSRK